MNCTYTNKSWKSQKENFMKTPIFQDFLQNNNQSPEYSAFLFQKYK